MAAYSFLNDAVGWSLNVLIYGHRAYMVSHDAARHGVLNVGNATAYVGVQSGILESAVAGRVESAVLQHEVVSVAEGLLARDMAIDQTEVAGVPAEILPIKLRVVYGHILHFPEGILSGDFRIMYLHVFHILEHIFAVAFKSVYAYVTAEHKRICAAVELKVANIEPLATPEDLISIVHHHTFYLDIAHLAEHLGRVNHRVLHFQVVAIPECGAAADIEIAAVDDETVYMPEGVVALETAVGRHDVAALLYGRLALAYGHVVEVQVVRGEQRALASKLGVADCLHCRYRFHVFSCLLSLGRASCVDAHLACFLPYKRKRLTAAAFFTLQNYNIPATFGINKLPMLRPRLLVWDCFCPNCIEPKSVIRPPNTCFCASGRLSKRFHPLADNRHI